MSRDFGSLFCTWWMRTHNIFIWKNIKRERLFAPFLLFWFAKLQCIQKCTINKRYNDKMKKTVTERNIKVENASILIVDDEKAIVDMIKRVLEKEGYRNILDAQAQKKRFPLWRPIRLTWLCWMSWWAECPVLKPAHWSESIQTLRFFPDGKIIRRGQIIGLCGWSWWLYHKTI